MSAWLAWESPEAGLTDKCGGLHPFPTQPPPPSTNCRYMHMYSGTWITLSVNDMIIRSKCSPASSWSGLSKRSIRFGMMSVGDPEPRHGWYLPQCRPHSPLLGNIKWSATELKQTLSTPRLSPSIHLDR